MLQTRVLGGEAGRRSFFGGAQNRPRAIGLTVVGLVGGVGTMYFQLAGLVPTVLAAAAVYLATLRSHGTGSLWSRWQTRRCWRERNRLGTIHFVPAQWSPQGDLDLPPAAFRDWPDGAEGMSWLQRGRGVAGICWHHPRGEDEYLSVAWTVDGQLHGIESDATVNGAATAWGEFLARFGSPHTLPSTVQILTRVLPVDSAWHEAWIAENLDPNAPPELVASYDELVQKTVSAGLMQRHYVVVRWPVTPRFKAAAARRDAPGQRGWLQLMQSEITTVDSALSAAHMGKVKALSAAQLAAVLRHQQLPSWPIDQVADVDVDVPWVATTDELSATIARGAGPDGRQAEWWHRTAVIPIEAMETGPRTPLWAAPLLSQMPYPVVRTISFHIEVVPQAQARPQARLDVTTDLADLAAQKERGVLVDAELEAGVSASQRRLDDLRMGTGHHGTGWVGHITISATSREDLIDATAKTTEAANNAGIAWLDWLDGQQAGAAACTWPLARGARPVGTYGARAWAQRLTSSGGPKEAL